jgi:hypothetical protein
VSHSGAHKQFAELLCRDLEAAGCSAFFDRESDSAAKGAASGAAALEAAAKCRVGILLLSEEFFTASKWPMMELATMKEYRRRITTSNVAVPAKILPVYYTLNVSRFTHYKRQEEWIKKWETMARNDQSINLEAWKAALGDIRKHPGIHICLAQRMIDDNEGRSMIVRRVTDPEKGFVDSGFIRRNAALFPILPPPGTFAHPRVILPPVAGAFAHGSEMINPPAAPPLPGLQSSGECSRAVEESDEEEESEGSEKDEDEASEKDENSPDRETTPSDTEEAAEDEGEMPENEEDEEGAVQDEDEDYDASGDGSNADSGSDGDNSG